MNFIFYSFIWIVFKKIRNKKMYGHEIWFLSSSWDYEFPPFLFNFHSYSHISNYEFPAFLFNCYSYSHIPNTYYVSSDFMCLVRRKKCYMFLSWFKFQNTCLLAEFNWNIAWNMNKKPMLHNFKRECYLFLLSPWLGKLSLSPFYSYFLIWY